MADETTLEIVLSSESTVGNPIVETVTVVGTVPVGPRGLTGSPGADGADGADGLSAYEVWLEEGNVGTEAQFLASLVGPQGDPGEQGEPGDSHVPDPSAEPDDRWLTTLDGALVYTDAPEGGGGVDDATYLVTTAHPDLSAEVVVGATPGGELGGTWASPTVDTVHSGSSHGQVQAAAEATAATALSAHEADTTNVHGITNTAALETTTGAQAKADAKVTQTITNGVTTTAPSEDAVHDALALKADLASPALSGTPTAPTAAPGTNTTQLSTTAFVQAAVAALINSAPGALDTLDELAAALGDDANFAATMTTALAGKQPLDADLTALAAAGNSAVLAATTASFLTADETKLDGIEALADVTDAANVAAAGAVMEADTTTAAMSFVVDEDDMASNSATKLPTQQSVKAYADAGDVALAGSIASGDSSTLASAQTYADGKVSDTAYNAGTWDAVTGVAPSKNAVRDKLEALDAAKANLASPTFTGTVTLPSDQALPGNPTTTTQASGNNSTRLATTAYVQTEAGLLVPKSLVDAKGDLLVGTADNTVGRLAVGSNNQVLTADSTQTAGVKWASAPAPSGAWRRVGSAKRNGTGNFTTTSTTFTTITHAANADLIDFITVTLAVGDIVRCMLQGQALDNSGNGFAIDFEVDRPTSANVNIATGADSGVNALSDNAARTPLHVVGEFTVTEAGSHGFRPLWRSVGGTTITLHNATTGLNDSEILFTVDYCTP